jgi:hypothetical protein
MRRENETGRNLMIRTILAPVMGNTPDAGGLAAAFLVAEAFQAHVDTLCIIPRALKTDSLVKDSPAC